MVFAELPNNIREELKDIEPVASKRLTSAYKLSLARKSDCAFGKCEFYFKVYTRFVLILKQHPEHLIVRTKNMTEGNYAMKVWGPVIEAVFNHPKFSYVGRVCKLSIVRSKEDQLCRWHN